MTPGPENALEEAAMNARDNAGARPEFYRQLMNANLFAIGTLSDTPYAVAASAQASGRRLSMTLVKRGDRQFHPVFSSLTRLRAFVGDARNVMTLPARGLFESTRGASFVLNPGWEFGKELVPEEIAYWLANAPAARKLPDRSVPPRLDRPDPYPTVLVKALSVLFVNRPVLSACLLQANFADPTEPSRFLLGVETDADWRKTIGEIAETIATANPDRGVEVIRLDRSQTSHPLIGPLLQTAPFYVRSKFIE